MNEITNPRNFFEFCIGSVDDFWCFDYYTHEDETMTLHAIISSETGRFIQEAELVRVPLNKAVDKAKEMVNDALKWCKAGDIKHDQVGWNQSPCYFWRSVHCSIAKNGPAIRIPVEMVYCPIITSNYIRNG